MPSASPFDPAAWVTAYEAIGGTVEVRRISGELFLATAQPRKSAGYDLDEQLGADPLKMKAVRDHLAEARGMIEGEGPPPLHGASWLRAYRAAGGKAEAYVYSGDENDPRDPFPILQTYAPPNSQARQMAEALTEDQRGALAEHIAQTIGAQTALGVRP